MAYGNLGFYYEYENADGDTETVFSEVYTWLDDELIEICTSDYMNHASHQHHEWNDVVYNVVCKSDIDTLNMDNLRWANWEEDMKRKVA